MGRKTKILVVVFLLLAVAAGCVVFFWDAIVMLFAPKLVLSSAIQQAISQLELRWSESPFSVLAKAYDASGKNTSAVNLSVEDNLLGKMEFDFQLKTDFSKNQIQAAGTIEGKEITFDTFVYLNKSFAAVSSQSLLQGGYYGITYATFSQDLRQIPFSTFLIPKETIAGWEKKVGDLEQWMSRSRTFPELPELSQKDLQLLTLGILALKCDITREERSVDSQNVQCYQYRYSANGTQIQPLVALLLGTQAQEEGSICADFYLVDRQLVEVELFVVSGSHQACYTIELGKDILNGPLSFGFFRKDGQTSNAFSVAVIPEQKGEGRWETVSINDTAFSYTWDSDSGALQLSLPEKDDMIWYLSEEEDGVSASTDDLSVVWKSLEGKKASCSMLIKKGAEISAPDYKNLDEWSFQDLLTLFTGIGTVLDIF